MINVMYFYSRILYLAIKKRMVPKQILVKDYNTLAKGYDSYFSKFTSPRSLEMVNSLDIKEGAIVLDLACGTGAITSELAKLVGQEGKVIAVDASPGMIAQAKLKVGNNVQFICGDMLKIIESFPENHFDFVTCGWAIGYSLPSNLLKKIRKVLKCGGKVGIIENRQDTLKPLHTTGLKVMQRYPQYIQYLMDLPLRLPKNKAYLERLYRSVSLNPLRAWEGQIEFNFKDGREVLSWVLHTGASAGFDKIMASEARELCDKAFVEIIEKDYKNNQGIKVLHKYVVGVAQK